MSCYFFIFSFLEIVISNTFLSEKFSRETAGRKQLLLLGDTLDDLGMAVHFDYDKKFTVAFLNQETESQRDEFVKKYDLVLKTDSLKPVLDLIPKF